MPILASGPLKCPTSLPFGLNFTRVVPTTGKVSEGSSKANHVEESVPLVPDHWLTQTEIPSSRYRIIIKNVLGGGLPNITLREHKKVVFTRSHLAEGCPEMEISDPKKICLQLPSASYETIAPHPINKPRLLLTSKIISL